LIALDTDFTTKITKENTSNQHGFFVSFVRFVVMNALLELSA